jgi:uncharacterized protein YegP (UPF0339 family)
MADKVNVYKGRDSLWRWKRIAPNGKIVGASTEGYTNKADCERNAQRNQRKP